MEWNNNFDLGAYYAFHQFTALRLMLVCISILPNNPIGFYLQLSEVFAQAVGLR